MFGAEFSELLFFGKQLGLALAGAAALWGLVFYKKSRHNPAREECVVYGWLSERLLIPLFAGILITFISLGVLFLIFPAQAHEGIVLSASFGEKYAALHLFSPVFAVWILFSLVGIFLKLAKPAFFHANLKVFYLAEFILIAILISFPIWLGELSRTQFFFIGHSVHSIFTLGTVLVLDFMFLTAKSSPILRQHIFPLFPAVSKVIWLGLGLDFLSAGIVFREAFVITPKFLFMQTVIGILIINGVLLSGPITRKLLDSVKENGRKMAKNWIKIGNLSGVLSASSWFTVTFVDSFEHLTINYIQFFLGYVGLILVFSAGRYILERFNPGVNV